MNDRMVKAGPQNTSEVFGFDVREFARLADLDPAKLLPNTTPAERTRFSALVIRSLREIPHHQDNHAKTLSYRIWPQICDREMSPRKTVRQWLAATGQSRVSKPEAETVEVVLKVFRAMQQRRASLARALGDF